MLELSPLVTEANASASLMPALVEVVAVEAEAHHRAPAEVGGQAPEGAGVLVDHRHGVVGLLEGAGQLAAHPAAADDDDVQLGLLVRRRRAGCYDPTPSVRTTKAFR